MIRKPVVSSNILSIGYDAKTFTLEIEFKGGAVYQYSNVPPEVHAQLMSAESHGKFFHANIREEFACQKIG